MIATFFGFITAALLGVVLTAWIVFSVVPVGTVRRRSRAIEVVSSTLIIPMCVTFVLTMLASALHI